MVELDENTIIEHGNSNEIMNTLQDNSIDLIITDPPYKDYHNRGKIKLTKKTSENFSPEVLINHIERLLKPTCHFYIFCDDKSFVKFYGAIEKSTSLHYKNMIVWAKNNHGTGDVYGNYALQHELIIFGVKGKGKSLNGRPSNVLYKKINGYAKFFKKVPCKVYQHPTIKPVEILEIFIKASSKEGDIVLDRYAGSFSTGHACINTGRWSINIELDKSHYENGMERLLKVINSND